MRGAVKVMAHLMFGDLALTGRPMALLSGAQLKQPIRE